MGFAGFRTTGPGCGCGPCCCPNPHASYSAVWASNATSSLCGGFAAQPECNSLVGTYILSHPSPQFPCEWVYARILSAPPCSDSEDADLIGTLFEIFLTLSTVGGNCIWTLSVAYFIQDDGGDLEGIALDDGLGNGVSVATYTSAPLDSSDCGGSVTLTKQSETARPTTCYAFPDTLTLNPL